MAPPSIPRTRSHLPPHPANRARRLHSSCSPPRHRAPTARVLRRRTLTPVANAPQCPHTCPPPRDSRHVTHLAAQSLVAQARRVQNRHGDDEHHYLSVLRSADRLSPDPAFPAHARAHNTPAKTKEKRTKKRKSQKGNEKRHTETHRARPVHEQAHDAAHARCAVLSAGEDREKRERGARGEDGTGTQSRSPRSISASHIEAKAPSTCRPGRSSGAWSAGAILTTSQPLHPSKSKHGARIGRPAKALPPGRGRRMTPQRNSRRVPVSLAKKNTPSGLRTSLRSSATDDSDIQGAGHEARLDVSRRVSDKDRSSNRGRLEGRGRRRTGEWEAMCERKRKEPEACGAQRRAPDSRDRATASPSRSAPRIALEAKAPRRAVEEQKQQLANDLCAPPARRISLGEIGEDGQESVGVYSRVHRHMKQQEPWVLGAKCALLNLWASVNGLRRTRRRGRVKRIKRGDRGGNDGVRAVQGRICAQNTPLGAGERTANPSRPSLFRSVYDSCRVASTAPAAAVSVASSKLDSSSLFQNDGPKIRNMQAT
ncbi:hypothetical protein FB451DRAFT_1182459 [Mycena latifolia]|nr:hypothetical protein FB451DRAFT_1182459 [Mycena latifolia]